MELRRSRVIDDQWVSTHNLEALLYSGAHVHAQHFCPIAGGRLAGTYTVVYVGKKDRQVRLNTVHSDDSEVARFLKTRVVGSPMAFYMLNGGEILDLGREVLFHDCMFAEAKIHLRSCLHKFARRDAEGASPFSTAKERYMSRPESLRHLRVEQFMRYFKTDHKQQVGASAEAALHHRQCVSRDHHLHPQHDEWSSKLECGTEVKYEKGTLTATRRSNAHLGCMRCLYVEPTSSLFKGTQRTQRDVYYEIRLYRALPWFQVKNQVQCVLPLTSGVLDGTARHNTTLLLRDSGDRPGALDYEAKCKRIENLMVNTLCACCEGRRTNPCEYCNNVLPRTGFHKCAFEDYLVWKPGTLYSVEENVAETHIIECRERGESFAMIRAHVQRFIADGQMTQEAGQRWLRLVAIEMGEPICFEADLKRRAGQIVEQSSAKDLEEQVEQLKKVWSFDENAYVLLQGATTSQYKAFETFSHIQASSNPLLAVVIAPAGFGKSELVKCFLENEKSIGRKWHVIASSGIAAVNVGGSTIHWFLGMNLAKEIDIKPGSALAQRLEECAGIVMDEAFTTDHEVWDVFLSACREFPLKMELRKANSLACFGHRDILLLADHWQTAPANGCAPMLVCGSFQKYFEVFVLKENRRQEKNPAYGQVLEAVKRGGSASDADSCDADVANMFIRSYVRGFGTDADNVDLELGRALFPQRHHKDRWNARVVKRLERECVEAEGVDITCSLGQGDNYRVYDECDDSQRQTKMKFPKILKLRTHPSHCMRLTLLHNLNLDEGLANGQKMRLLPSASWSHEPERLERGRDGTVRAKEVHHLSNDKFQVFVAKERDMEEASKQSDLGALRTYTLQFVETDVERYGRQCQIPVELGYASSIHKSQGSTEPRIWACLENIWAHGMAYVVTSRTRLEEDLRCIGVPPRDLAEEVAKAVWDAREEISTALSVWNSLENDVRQEFHNQEHGLPCDFCACRNQREKVLHAVLHDRRRFVDFRKAVDTKALLEQELERLDPTIGLAKTLGITENFKNKCLTDRKAGRQDAAIKSRRIFVERMASIAPCSRGKRAKEWLTLLQILRPDPLAWETYKKIDEWVHAVDVLNQETVVVHERDADGVILNRTPFPVLPDMETKWWASGDQEERWDAAAAVGEDGVKSAVKQARSEDDNRKALAQSLKNVAAHVRAVAPLATARDSVHGRCPCCEKQVTLCTCYVCPRINCVQMFQVEASSSSVNLLNCKACQKKEGRKVQVRGRCGKCFHTYGAKLAKKECMCSGKQRLARCVHHCGQLLAVRDWVSHGKPGPAETTRCARNDAEVAVDMATLECVECSKSIKDCTCGDESRGKNRRLHSPGQNTDEERQKEPETQEAVQVCPQCKERCPSEVDAQNRYWCAQCKVQQRTTLCGRCHADWKECTCRLVVTHACPHEQCPGKITHDAKRDSKGRVTCSVCKERQVSRQAVSMTVQSKNYLSILILGAGLLAMYASLVSITLVCCLEVS